MTDQPSPFRYESTATLVDLAGRIRDAQRVLVTAHAKPDGDALGSVLALERALRRLNLHVDAYLTGPLDPGLDQLAGETVVHAIEDGLPGDEYDLVIVCDTGAWAQLEPLSEWLRDRRDCIIGFDHHASGDDVAPTRLIDTSKASTTQLLVDLMDELGVEIDGGPGGVGEALFVGMATDTGWFQFQNADATAFEVAARLLRAGVDKIRLYQIIEETARPTRLALEARALASVEFLRDGEVVMMGMGPEDFAATGGTTRELTGIVNIPLRVGAVRVSILLTQAEPGVTKISFRAKPSVDGAPFTDVNKLAGQFGGGGHKHAAGARLPMDLDEARQTIRQAL